MEHASILLVEDDTNLGAVLQEYMSIKGYTVDLYRDGESGWQAFERQAGNYDLCILDVMMPKKDGFTLAKAIREADGHIPIVFVTAKSMQNDKIEGFRLGADDYITKPFSIEELMMRVQAILRRVQYSSSHSSTTTTPPDIFTFGHYTFDYPNQTLRYTTQQQQETRQLTSKEAELLRLLCLNMNNVLKREVALKSIWGDDNYFNGRSMDVFITKLRKHLKFDPTVEILNVHGSGYKLLINASLR
jgi:DNA-binding response OmpR family regulator